VVANVSFVSPLSMSAAPATAIRVVHDASVTLLAGGLEAEASVAFDRAPASSSFSCNGAAFPVVMSGDRPVTLRASLQGLAAGVSYACRFSYTDVDGVMATASAPVFVAGADTTAPTLLGVRPSTCSTAPP